MNTDESVVYENAEAKVVVVEKKHPSNWGLNTVACGLSNGTSLWYSPTKNLSAEAIVQLEKFGKPCAFVAPNYFHYLGIFEHHHRMPSVEIVASPVAVPRLQKKLDGMSVLPITASQVHNALGDHITLLSPDGLKTGEVWLLIQGSKETILIESDAFFNVNATTKGFYGFALRLTKTVPGLRIGNTFMWLALENGTTYRKWLIETLEKYSPTVLIPSHGDVIEDPNLSSRLIDLAKARFN